MYTVGQRLKEGTAQKALLQIPALATMSVFLLWTSPHFYRS